MGCHSSDFTMTDCIFLDNSGIDAGGIWISRSSPTLLRCIFADNEAMFWGGGVVCYNESTPLLRQCTFTRNDAYEGGGAWVLYNSNPVFENCVVAFNLDGWGIWADETCNPAFLCCDVFQNVEGNYGGDLPDQTGINGNISADPLFCDSENGDFRLHSESPCAWANNPDCGYIGALPIGCGETTSMDTELPAVGGITRIFPNPSAGSVRIDFQFPIEGWVSVDIVDVTGRLIRSLFERPYPKVYAGVFSLTWEGRNDSGQRVSPGAYFTRIVIDNRVETKRIVLIR